MIKRILGKDLEVSAIGLGCMGLFQSYPPFPKKEEEIRFLRRAVEMGQTFFDTSEAYAVGENEELVGEALAPVRDQVKIATKFGWNIQDGKIIGLDSRPGTIRKAVDESLKRLKTDHIDLYQFHCVNQCWARGAGSGMYECMTEAKAQGKILHIGVTAHKLQVAFDCVESGLYETMQFPFSYLSSEKEKALVQKCKEAGMGFIAMKGLAGGMLTNARACQAFMNGYDNVVPIWGIQRLEELDEWVALGEAEVEMDEDLAAFIQKEQQELSGSFCRSCGYCMPCPVGIEIRNCARMDMLLRRSPWQPYMSEEWRQKMEKINDCLECHRCSSRCPYQLDTPNLLKYMLKDYREFYIRIQVYRQILCCEHSHNHNNDKYYHHHYRSVDDCFYHTHKGLLICLYFYRPA